MKPNTQQEIQIKYLYDLIDNLEDKISKLKKKNKQQKQKNKLLKVVLENWKGRTTASW